jgi:murein DD-endopeptidase MepM/ murein hydrolase activator NlpD
MRHRLILPIVLAALAFPAAAAAYPWPVKPFDRQHPVRGSFGDPRMVFKVPPTQRDLITGGGAFSFHFGVDISALDGTTVYPVVSGTVSQVTKDWVGVDTGGGRAFQYWHIQAAVKKGDAVQARTTELGTILKDCGHVHLTELRGGASINPLSAGHLTPYADKTAPGSRRSRFAPRASAETCCRTSSAARSS